MLGCKGSAPDIELGGIPWDGGAAPHPSGPVWSNSLCSQEGRGTWLAPISIPHIWLLRFGEFRESEWRLVASGACTKSLHQEPLGASVRKKGFCPLHQMLKRCKGSNPCSESPGVHGEAQELVRRRGLPSPAPNEEGASPPPAPNACGQMVQGGPSLHRMTTKSTAAPLLLWSVTNGIWISPELDNNLECNQLLDQ